MKSETEQMLKESRVLSNVNKDLINFAYSEEKKNSSEDEITLMCFL